MIKKVIDHRFYRNTARCDAVLEIFSNLKLSEEHRIIKGFESEDIDYILDYAEKLKYYVIVYLYDLNSKPLK
jgi:hypothetical protein